MVTKMMSINVSTQPISLLLKVIAFALTIFSSFANAIDNPDAPDLVAEFEAREKPLVDSAEKTNGYRASLVAYTDYLNFLDKELNTAYKNLQAKLPADKQQQLKQSQVAWLKYRDLEFALIENAWTKADFGSSSSITRGQFKANIVRDRAIQLMHYTRAH
jgi:uncharacterized protein YecT (DUF1311 family)